jgi:hypothetical protein
MRLREMCFCRRDSGVTGRANQFYSGMEVIKNETYSFSVSGLEMITDSAESGHMRDDFPIHQPSALIVLMQMVANRF